MNKFFPSLILLISSFFIQGQQITFQKNINYQARELKQSLNENRDSLNLESDKIIYQVDIFNENYSNSISVNNNESTIGLDILPVGKFIIQARLKRKWIVMYLVKSEATEISEKSIIVANASKDQNSDNNTSVKKSTKKRTGFWVVHESITGSGSTKSMSFRNKDEVSRLIAKNKAELNTAIAMNNILVVYEVYNMSQFMRNQFKNPSYFKSSESKAFNVVPYYSSNHYSI
ncbi:hypothetical protein [Winogradskyella sp. Asnod2-B02-A]|uniref:hypothetical protein n=1 Tax=Winogradskyella sp. Asnod2-B02-A TaxID=3160583 RepID=UPI00386BE347